jgi:hypothetical protein
MDAFMEDMALVLEKEERVFVEKVMNKTFLNFFAFGTNWLRRMFFNKAAFWLSEKLYNSINIDQIYGEVYQDCHDMMKITMPDIDQNWQWMQKEHIEFLFGSRAISNMRPESVALAHKFEDLLPKKHSVAMATMEAFKADYRDDQIKKLLKEILVRLQIPATDADVLFGIDKNELTAHPKFKEVHFSKRIHVPEEKNKEVDDLARLVVTGTAVDWITKMMEQKEKLATIAPVTGHRYDSFVPVSFGVMNCGDVAIDRCTVFFTFPDFVQLKRSNVERTMFPDILNPNSSTWVFDDEHLVKFNVGDITLGFGRRSEDVYVRIPYDVKQIEINWFLSSKTMKKYGKLTIKNEPEYVQEYRQVEELPEENPQYEDVVMTLSDVSVQKCSKAF